MAQTINTNVASLNAQRNLTSSQSSLATSLQRLSSGLRINSAKDDAAGLAISERFNTQIRGINQAVRNANDGISLTQTAEGALGEIGNNLQRIRELAVQSRNATNSTADREALQKEVTQLKSEIDRVANQTKFNGTSLLSGSFVLQEFQVGADQGQTIAISKIADANIDALGTWTSVKTPASPVSGTAPLGTAGAAATAGSVATSAPIALNAAIAFSVDGNAVSIDGSSSAYADADAAAAAIQADLDGAATGVYTVSAETGGEITISKVATGASSTAPVIAGADSSIFGTGSDGADAGAATFTALSGAALTINGENIEVGTSADAATRLNDLVSAINAKAADTGVTAEVASGALKLTSIGGSGDINIGGTDGAVVTAQTGLTVGNNAGTAGSAQTGFSSLDISSIAGADNAILAMDAALKAINDSRAELGAIQNRFTSTIASLQTTSENLSASRGRIVDADFAQETANLTRSQILQQAGTAMLAQANGLPQNVLSLLRG